MRTIRTTKTKVLKWGTQTLVVRPLEKHHIFLCGTSFDDFEYSDRVRDAIGTPKNMKSECSTKGKKGWLDGPLKEKKRKKIF